MNPMNLKNLEGRLAIINNRYWLYESAISKKQCELILEEANWNLKHMAEFMESHDSKVNDAIRKTTVTFAPYYSPVGCIMSTHLLEINKHQWNYDISGIQEIQIGHYEEGGHYDWHPDTMTPDENNMQRKLSAVLMLSDPNDYEGGLLEIKDAELPKLKQGSIVVFPSPLIHRVTKVTKGNRFTAVAWAVGPAFR
jgi:PKHD-type hydroxylase